MERLVERLVDEVRALKDRLEQSQLQRSTMQRERRATQLEVQRLEAERIALEASHEERITAKDAQKHPYFKAVREEEAAAAKKSGATSS